KHLHQARLYGLLADEATPAAPYLRDQLTALYGIEEVRVPRHGFEPVKVDAVFTPVKGGQRPCHRREDHLLKRQGIHEHHVRTRRTVRLAQALDSCDVEELKATFPDVAPCLTRESPGRVGVLVDVISHGLQLAESLRWPFVA